MHFKKIAVVLSQSMHGRENVHDQPKLQNEPQKLVRNCRCTPPWKWISSKPLTPWEFSRSLSPRPLQNFQFPPWWGLDIFWKHTMAYVSQINFAFCPKALKLVEFQLLFFVITTAKIKWEISLCQEKPTIWNFLNPWNTELHY